jgi:hypothetical protein
MQNNGNNKIMDVKMGWTSSKQERNKKKYFKPMWEIFIAKSHIVH